jgi:DNA-binding response OmpR family regulator
MEKKSILIVDDEKNIRLTLSRSLEPLEFPIETAVNGEEALQKLHEGVFSLVFLDLKMPGMDGMDVLRHIKEKWSKTRVIIITAHGTIASAVEAMKLGAVDFIQKPFSPGEIRDLAKLVISREALDEENAVDYRSLIELAKRHISDRSFSISSEIVRKAIAADPAQPEAYNLLGVLLEIKHDWLKAQKFYRAALEIDPTFKPAQANLERTTSWYKFGKIDLGPEMETPPVQKKGGKEIPNGIL